MLFGTRLGKIQEELRCFRRVWSVVVSCLVVRAFDGGDDARCSVRLFRYFLATYPVRSTLMPLSITTAAIAEGLGIAAVLPLINLAIDAEHTFGDVRGLPVSLRCFFENQLVQRQIGHHASQSRVLLL